MSFAKDGSLSFFSQWYGSRVANGREKGESSEQWYAGRESGRECATGCRRMNKSTRLAPINADALLR